MKPTPYAANGMYRIQRLNNNNGSIIKMQDIIRSCHLLPYYPPNEDSMAWHGPTVLEKCDTFYLNKYIDVHTFAALAST